MIIFVTTAAHGYTVKPFLESAPRDIRNGTLTLAYDEFLGWPRLPVGHYLLADVDRLDAYQRHAVRDRLDALRMALPTVTILNHPVTSLGRLALLRVLHADGINRFQARPADGALEGLRFPVFVREAVEHRGALTGLIESSAQLAETLATLRAGGLDLSGCLVIEFVDVRNDRGQYEKYSVLRIGERYIASDLSLNRHWVCKGEASEAILDGESERDEAFQRHNPHVEHLKPIFARAGIAYGRIDYAFSAGALQVFEINTNPTLSAPSQAPAAYRASTARYAEGICEALRPMARDRHGGQRSVLVAGAVPSADVVVGDSRFRTTTRRILRRLDLLRYENTVFRWRDRLR